LTQNWPQIQRVETNGLKLRGSIHVYIGAKEGSSIFTYKQVHIGYEGKVAMQVVQKEIFRVS